MGFGSWIAYRTAWCITGVATIGLGLAVGLWNPPAGAVILKVGTAMEIKALGPLTPDDAIAVAAGGPV